MLAKFRTTSPFIIVIAAMVSASLTLTNDYHFDVASTAMTFVVLGAAFNLLYGYVGLLSFAQVAFVGIGGYTTAWLATQTSMPHPVAFLAGGLVAASAAALIGVVTVRLSEGAFAIITLSLTLLCALVAADWTSVTGGRQGIFGLPAPAVSMGSSTFAVATPRDYFILLAVFTVAALWVMRRIVTSSVGKVLIAIRDNEPLAQAQGYASNKYKLFIFTVCGGITGLAGALHVFRLTVIDPSIFDFNLMQAMLIIVILGGAGTFWPVVCSAVLFAVLPEFLRVTDEARLIIYGLLLVIGLLFAPQGVGGMIRRRMLNRRLREVSEAAR